MSCRTSAVPAASESEAHRRADDLYARFHTPVLRYCRGQLRSQQEAEDAAQNTFLRAFVALKKGVTPEYEVAWLYRIAHNVCMTRRLSATRRSRVESAQGLDDVARTVSAPELERPEEVGHLGDALSELPEHFRRAILLREWQGLSYAEIAEALGATIPAVETLIFRARRALAEALRPQEPELEPLLAA